MTFHEVIDADADPVVYEEEPFALDEWITIDEKGNILIDSSVPRTHTFIARYVISTVADKKSQPFTVSINCPMIETEETIA